MPAILLSVRGILLFVFLAFIGAVGVVAVLLGKYENVDVNPGLNSNTLRCG